MYKLFNIRKVFYLVNELHTYMYPLNMLVIDHKKKHIKRYLYIHQNKIKKQPHTPPRRICLDSSNRNKTVNMKKCPERGKLYKTKKRPLKQIKAQ
jgi:hypothetical protein